MQRLHRGRKDKDTCRYVYNNYMFGTEYLLELSKSVKFTFVKEKRQGSSSYVNNKHIFGNRIVSIH